jgi:glycosyltransferase involved in cell wall biosynthesis
MRILIISHVTANSGAIDRYEDYLLRRNYKISKLTHPLDNYKKQETTFYIDGKINWSLPRKDIGTRNLLIDFKLTLQTLRKTKYDVVIGANNFDTYCAIFMNKFFKKNIKIIYFASDFSDHRFNKRLLDSFYTRVEQLTLKDSNYVISNTQRSVDKRLDLGLKPNKSILIFNTAYIKNPSFPKKIIDKSRFIFVGSLNEEHGLYKFLEYCGLIIDELTIIGDGPDRNKILEYSKLHKIKLKYHGQKDHAWTMKYMQKFQGLGVAPYDTASTDYVHYGSSLKIYEYLACGLPVITSTATEQSAQIASYGLGIVYDSLNIKQIQQKLREFSLEKFNVKAKIFYELYNQDSQYAKALPRVLFNRGARKV